MRVAVLTMQKNEGELLPSWVDYHGAIFGYENLFVLDNGSTVETNIAQLHRAKDQGANVDFSHNSPQDFENKGILLSKIINDNMEKYDFFVPLDIDEFLALACDQPMSHTAEQIFAEFRRLQDAPDQFVRIRNCYYNLAHSTRVRPGQTQKLAIKPGNPVNIDEGFHLFDWSRGIDTTPTGRTAPSNLAHIHFHRKNYEALLTSAREKLKLRVPSYRASVLEGYTGHGTHLASYFKIQPQNYRDDLYTDNTLDIAESWQRWNIGPVPFSAPPSLDGKAVAAMLDPVNLAAISKKGNLAIESLAFLRTRLAGLKSLLHIGFASSLYLACEIGLTSLSLVEADMSRLQKLSADPDITAYIFTNRLHFINPFTDDIRMEGAPRGHLNSTEFLEFSRYIGKKDYQAAIFSGALRFAAVSFFFSPESPASPPPERAFFIASKEEDLTDLEKCCDIGERSGLVFECLRNSEKTHSAALMFQNERRKFVSS